MTSDFSTSERERGRARRRLERSAPHTASAAARSKPPAKHASREQDLLVLLQQVVRPVDQRAQRLLARQRGAAAAGQELEAVVAAAR